MDLYSLIKIDLIYILMANFLIVKKNFFIKKKLINNITMSVTFDNNFYRFNCPHCNRSIEVQKNQQIGPHTKKQECDRLVNEDLIYGCGKPFRFITKNNINSIEICGYI